MSDTQRLFGLLGQPFPQDEARYSFANNPAVDFPANTMRPLNFRNLVDLGAMRFTYPGTGVANGGANLNDQENFSVVSMYNDLGDQTPNWPTHQRQNEFAAMLQNAQQDMTQPMFYMGKYNQLVDSARRLGLLDEDIFLPASRGEGAMR